MRKWIGGTIIGFSWVLGSAAAVSAQSDGVFVENDGSELFGTFAAIVGVMLVIGIGTSIYRFSRVRELGINRGLSERDATTAALFSDSATTAALTLRDAADQPDVEDRLQKIEDLRTKGLITDAEAASRRDEILDEI